MNYDIEKVEVFAKGKWHGINFSESDLDAIIEAFNKNENITPSLKLGHNDEQKLKDGMLSFGYVSKLWKSKDDAGDLKLFASFKNVPEIVYNAIKLRRFKKVSIEIFRDVKTKFGKFKYLLSGVAILGAQLPEVDTLNDIAHYMSRDNEFTDSDLLTFSAVDNQGNLIKETLKMSITKEELKAKLAAQKAELEAKFSKQSKDSELEAELEAEKAKVAKFKKEKADAEKAEAKKKIEMSRETVTKLLDDAVKDMSITPVQKESFTKLLGVETDSVVDVSIEDVKALIGENKSSFSKDKSKSGKNKQGENMTAGEELDVKAREYMDDHPKVNYSRALEVVMSKEKDLAAEHVNATVGGAE
ncbi:MAG TPA: hypothetical protein ENJ28_01160 [Gammaproteobacteria bacterium]|nr:hypothetical protein [Gammaproteobacteria bacterium]